MRKLIAPITIVVAASLLLAACGALPNSGPDACDGEGLLFIDDFDGESNCGWVTYNRGGTTVEVVDGSMQISTSQTGQLWWTNPSRNFDDVVITTEAKQASGPDDNAYGLICRYQNEENFYLFLISGDGYYAIGKYQSGSPEVTYLTPDNQFQPSDAINKGSATNQIEARCIGDELSLTVNGVPLATVQDPTFVTGDFGLAASTLQPGTSIIEFDSVRVTQP